jgi:hypothetical protein
VILSADQVVDGTRRDIVKRVERHKALEQCAAILSSDVRTGQRFGEIARTVTSKTDVFILFRQSEPLDLDGVAKRISREIAERVKNLGPHEFIVYDVRKQNEVEFEATMFSPESKARTLAHIERGNEELEDEAPQEDEAVRLEQANGMRD